MKISGKTRQDTLYRMAVAKIKKGRILTTSKPTIDPRSEASVYITEDINGPEGVSNQKPEDNPKHQRKHIRLREILRQNIDRSAIGL